MKIRRFVVFTLLILILPLGNAAGEDLAQVNSPQAVTGTAFTYQGRLEDVSGPVEGSCDFKFSLWDASSGGTQQGSEQTLTGVTLSDGYFSVALNGGGEFGGNAFQGEARYLQIKVKCGGDSAYTTLSGRVALTAAPYALALPGLWTQQNTISPNIIGGYHGNSVGVGIRGATIGGGGSASNINQVNLNYDTVGGGKNNTASGPNATVGGGDGNTANGSYATVAGGGANTADFSATVGGGSANTASNDNATVSGGYINTASGYASTVGGGEENTANGSIATISGGYQNIASGPSATVGGGEGNNAFGYAATVGGGYYNVANQYTAVVVGGEYNTADGYAAVVGGGAYNDASIDYATVSGGYGNEASQFFATVSGGYDNTASGMRATISGGYQNIASGNTSTVGGGESNTASIDYATVGGGSNNAASNYAVTVSGGITNTATAGAATVSGGYLNIASGYTAVVSGGSENTAVGYAATVGGGTLNSAAGDRATVSGGYENTTSNDEATVSGGRENTASGNYAAVSGGYLNTASGFTAAVGGGTRNVAVGDRATVPGGDGADASHYGQWAYASGYFAQAGDAQASLYVLRAVTSSARTWEDLYLDGNTRRLAIANNHAMTFDILIVGQSDSGESAGYTCVGVIENVNGTTTLLGAPCTEIGEDDAAWSAQLVEDDRLNLLRIQVMGNDENIRWVATVRAVEVGW